MDREQATAPQLPAARLLELVATSLRGDMKAFEALFSSAEPSLFRMGLAITGNVQAAEEALAETALAVLESLVTLRDSRHFYTWATRIMINACYALGRQQRKVVPIGGPPRNLQLRLASTIEGLS